MSALTLLTMRDLHSRSSAGILVKLLWDEHDGRVAVAVADTTTGDAFAIDVREDDCPMDVFHHPYAYASWRGIETTMALSQVESIDQLTA